MFDSSLNIHFHSFHCILFHHFPKHVELQCSAAAGQIWDFPENTLRTFCIDHLQNPDCHWKITPSFKRYESMAKNPISLVHLQSICNQFCPCFGNFLPVFLIHTSCQSLFSLVFMLGHHSRTSTSIHGHASCSSYVFQSNEKHSIS